MHINYGNIYIYTKYYLTFFTAFISRVCICLYVFDIYRIAILRDHDIRTPKERLFWYSQILTDLHGLIQFNILLPFACTCAYLCDSLLWCFPCTLPVQPSGSTGTFALAIPSTDGKTVELRVVCSDLTLWEFENAVSIIMWKSTCDMSFNTINAHDRRYHNISQLVTFSGVLTCSQVLPTFLHVAEWTVWKMDANFCCFILVDAPKLVQTGYEMLRRVYLCLQCASHCLRMPPV